MVGESVGGLDHRRARRIQVVIGRKVRAQKRHRLDLLNRVEVLALIELDVRDRERFEPRSDATPRLADPFGDRANLAVGFPQRRDDAVRLTQLVGAKDDHLVAIRRHASIVAVSTARALPTRENGGVDSLFVIPLWLDLLAVAIGAFQGAMFASRYRDAELDLLGVALIGIVSGFGGGIVRDIFLSTEIAAFHDNGYLITATIAALFGMLIARFLHKIEMVITLLDALTIGIFGAIGTTKALSFGLPVIPALFIGVAAAVGGSIIRDMLLALPIQLMQVGSLYAVAAGIGGATVIGLLALGQDVTVSGIAGVAVTTTIRMLSVILGWKLPAQREVPTVTTVIRTIRKRQTE